MLAIDVQHGDKRVIFGPDEVTRRVGKRIYIRSDIAVDRGGDDCAKRVRETVALSHLVA